MKFCFENIKKIFTLKEAIRAGLVKWSAENDAPYYGPIPGYVMAFNYEWKNDNGEITYSSAEFGHSLDVLMMNPHNYSKETYEDLGYSFTGNIIFRGYYSEEYIPEERDFGYVNASNEVVRLMNQRMKRKSEEEEKDFAFTIGSLVNFEALKQ